MPLQTELIALLIIIAAAAVIFYFITMRSREEEHIRPREATAPAASVPTRPAPTAPRPEVTVKKTAPERESPSARTTTPKQARPIPTPQKKETVQRTRAIPRTKPRQAPFVAPEPRRESFFKKLFGIPKKIASLFSKKGRIEELSELKRIAKEIEDISTKIETGQIDKKFLRKITKELKVKTKELKHADNFISTIILAFEKAKVDPIMLSYARGLKESTQNASKNTRSIIKKSKRPAEKETIIRLARQLKSDALNFQSNLAALEDALSRMGEEAHPQRIEAAKPSHPLRLPSPKDHERSKISEPQRQKRQTRGTESAEEPALSIEEIQKIAQAFHQITGEILAMAGIGSTFAERRGELFQTLKHLESAKKSLQKLARTKGKALTAKNSKLINKSITLIEDIISTIRTLKPETSRPDIRNILKIGGQRSLELIKTIELIKEEPDKKMKLNLPKIRQFEFIREIDGKRFLDTKQAALAIKTYLELAGLDALLNKLQYLDSTQIRQVADAFEQIRKQLERLAQLTKKESPEVYETFRNISERAKRTEDIFKTMLISGEKARNTLISSAPAWLAQEQVALVKVVDFLEREKLLPLEGKQETERSSNHPLTREIRAQLTHLSNAIRSKDYSSRTIKQILERIKLLSRDLRSVAIRSPALKDPRYVKAFDEIISASLDVLHDRKTDKEFEFSTDAERRSMLAKFFERLKAPVLLLESAPANIWPAQESSPPITPKNKRAAELAKALLELSLQSNNPDETLREKEEQESIARAQNILKQLYRELESFQNKPKVNNALKEIIAWEHLRLPEENRSQVAKEYNLKSFVYETIYPALSEISA